MFKRLGNVEAQKNLNQVGDEVNYHPNLVGGEINQELEFTLALKDHDEEPRASDLSHLGKQGAFALPNLRDGQIATLAHMVQALLECMDNQGEQNDTDRTLVVPASPLGSLLTLAPHTEKDQHNSSRPSGSSDPQVHIINYNSYMGSIRATNATKCRLFPLTLNDQAHMLFTSLTPYSMDTFQQLARLFVSHFSTMAPRPSTKQR